MDTAKLTVLQNYEHSIGVLIAQPLLGRLSELGRS